MTPKITDPADIDRAMAILAAPRPSGEPQRGEWDRAAELMAGLGTKPEGDGRPIIEAGSGPGG